jgi:hypothetical protein
MELLAYGEGRWQVAEIWLASLSVHVEDLATRLSATIYTWHEEGLCAARGFGARLPSGRLLLIAEPEHDGQLRRPLGASLLVDAADLAAQGAESLLTEILEAISLSHTDVTAAADRTTEECAARLTALSRSDAVS